MTDRFFPYRFDARFKPFLFVFGLREGRDGVTLTSDGRLRASFGLLSLETPLANVAGAHITGDYAWYRAIGVRLSLKDAGLTFGTNTDQGVCVHFVEPVSWVIGFRDHSALTATVADCDGLVEALGPAPPR